MPLAGTSAVADAGSSEAETRTEEEKEPVGISTENREHSTTVVGIDLDEFDSTNESTLADIRDGASWKTAEESPIVSTGLDR